MIKWLCRLLVIGALLPATLLNAGEEKKLRRRQELTDTPTGVWEKVQVLAARPTATTVDLNLVAAHDTPATIECDGRKFAINLRAATPTSVQLDDLQPDTAYSYKIVLSADAPNNTSPPRHFHTQRRAGSPFVFVVQGDAHPERAAQNNPAQYATTLTRIAADKPDFMLMLGDDFGVDTLKNINRQTVEQVYRAHRRYLCLVDAPLFLVGGNHEQAARCNLDGTPNNVAVWAQNARENYFSQPAPTGIYSGDTENVEHIGLLRDYYAWEWGDALFITLDPYWQTPTAIIDGGGNGDKNKDQWHATIGTAQYRWLQQTLANSNAKYKFVFTHHLNGRGRGGVECATTYEWGGKNRRGISEFATRRPDWEMPIHDLLVKHRVAAVFQGHDHLFAQQVLDGVVYQTLPLPAGAADARENADAYRSGKIISGSGYIRVHVAPSQTRVEFVDTYTGKVLYEYEIKMP